MPRRQSYPTPLVRVAAASIALATCAPGAAHGATLDLARWLADAAAPALEAAAPTNDPGLAARELLSRGLPGAFTQLQPSGPAWLRGVRLSIGFDPTFQPGYALSAAQPLFRAGDGDASLELHGGGAHDPAGRTGGSLGFRYRARLDHRPLMLGLEAAVEDHWREQRERYTLGTELDLSPFEARVRLFDDVLRNPATPEVPERRLDGYDLEINARIPSLPWASLGARRFRQIEASSNAVITQDRLSLRLTPLAALEVEAGTEAQTELRSWFAQLRWRIGLGS
jgi:Inverse autotransporter, beta-domain